MPGSANLAKPHGKELANYVLSLISTSGRWEGGPGCCGGERQYKASIRHWRNHMYHPKTSTQDSPWSHILNQLCGASSLGENSPGCCSQIPTSPSLRRACPEQWRKRDEREGELTHHTHSECPARGGEQDWGLGGLGQALPPQLHNEGFSSPLSPQTLKAEHPTRILTMDTP